MLKMQIENWKTRIDRLFEAKLYDEIVISNKVTKELTNFEFCLVPQQVDDKLNPPDPEEWIERDFIISQSEHVYKKFLSNDINSRQGSFVNNYDGIDNHCISYFHHYVRDDKYCMNVYVRSMNYLANFVFDCYTFNLAYDNVFQFLKKDYPDVQKGFIRVFCFSLHIIE